MAEEKAIDTSSKPYTQEVATAANDIDLFAGWLTRLENPDDVLRYESGGRGVRVYEELERDWQVGAMLQTRSLALQACEWQVEPATEKRADKKIAEYVEKVFKGASFDRLTGDLMQAVLCGYKASEIMWEASEGDIWINEFRGRRPSRFVFDLNGQLRLLTPTNMVDGQPVPDRKFVRWSFGGHDWNPYGRGLGYQSYWPVWFKKNGIKFWVVFCEKFASPTAVGKYPTGTSPDDKDTLLNALTAIEQQTGIRIPDTMAIEYLEAKRAGDSSYSGLCDYMDGCIAKIFLGQTLSSDSGDKGSGSYALGRVHNEVRHDILKADADSMCEAINGTVVRWLVDYNFPVAGRDAYPRVWRRTEPESDLKPLAERDKILLVDLGMKHRVAETYIEDTYGIPLAKDGEATIGDAAPPEPEPGVPGATGALPGQAGPGAVDKGKGATEGKGKDGKTGKGKGDADTFAEQVRLLLGQAGIDRIGDEAIDRASDLMAGLIAPVTAMIDSASSLEEIGEKIYALYPALDSYAFQELLARAMFAAALTGDAAAQGEAD